MKLTNEEIARVFAMYWGNRIDAGMITVVDGYWMNKISQGETDTVLLLTPLSKISDKDAIEVAKIHDHHNIKAHYSTEDLRAYLISQGKRMVQTMSNGVRVNEELKLRGYDVKLYCFGIGHWANGKTAIELEIAIDKTTL